MISCTDFIPAYSELFSFLDEKYGRESVDRLWDALFKPQGDQGIPLINFVQREGIRGCFSYWSGTLSEEAAEFSMFCDPEKGYFYIDMHKCPSKGRLLEEQKKRGLKPFRDYCLHCDQYRQAVEQVGLKYIYNFSGTDHASCNLLIYDEALFQGQVKVDENTLVMKRKASDNEYFHPAFHSSMNLGLQYLGQTYGEAAVTEYLVRYAKVVLRPVIRAIEKEGISALKDYLLDIYCREKAQDAITLTVDGKTLTLLEHYDPCVKYLKDTGKNISAYLSFVTPVVLQTLAKEGGLSFEKVGEGHYVFAQL